MRQLFSTSNFGKKALTIMVTLVACFLVALMTAKLQVLALFVSFFLVSAIVFAIAIFANPKVGFYIYLVYCFVIAGLLRNTTNLNLGPLMELLLALTWIAMLVNHANYEWKNIRNDHCILTLAWFIYNFLQILNPGASVLGWLNETRFTAFNWLVLAPLPFVLFNTKKDLNIFLIAILSFSLVAFLYGMKQLYIGVSGPEQRWLDNGADFTHIVFGKLRVFSFFTDAGQFGAQQAAMAVVAFVLALGKFTTWKRIIFGVAGACLFYGMLISGTRGALFALVVGCVFAIALSKQYKIMIIGSIVTLLFLGFLKYTKIGNSSYEIYRLRSALDPQDASLNARLMNQQRLSRALSSLPFGGGVGISGFNGSQYNKGKYLASIPPDSYWVKIWVMYGVVGLTIWFSINMYLLGKCCGVVWKLKDPRLRSKAMALTAFAGGVFFCSYGNEVMNGFPTSVILIMSWSFVLMAPSLDKIDSK
ncbi:O-antigen ligase family protein [Pedobacter deserti]|uniref:O-antigen ligase family protein n=1 Tax=Pedobacter deserti TaxID=2817382 RepID=UPI00210CC70E|nr:O-antigen ligase family protein [Pedobacter sp. SYSU D00382]